MEFIYEQQYKPIAVFSPDGRPVGFKSFQLSCLYILDKINNQYKQVNQIETTDKIQKRELVAKYFDREYQKIDGKLSSLVFNL